MHLCFCAVRVQISWLIIVIVYVHSHLAHSTYDSVRTFFLFVFMQFWQLASASVNFLLKKMLQILLQRYWSFMACQKIVCRQWLPHRMDLLKVCKYIISLNVCCSTVSHRKRKKSWLCDCCYTSSFPEFVHQSEPMVACCLNGIGKLGVYSSNYRVPYNVSRHLKANLLGISWCEKKTNWTLRIKFVVGRVKVHPQSHSQKSTLDRQSPEN